MGAEPVSVILLYGLFAAMPLPNPWAKRDTLPMTATAPSNATPIFIFICFKLFDDELLLYDI
jgi:hypothetical protein